MALLLSGLTTESPCPENANEQSNVDLFRSSGFGLIQVNVFISVSYESLMTPLIKSEDASRLRGRTNGLYNGIKMHKAINNSLA